MSGLLDDQKITVPCPSCEREIPLTVGKARRSPTVTCTCGQKVALDSSQFAREMGKVDAAERAMDDALKGFPKTIGG
jgi:hypothetical protein